METFHSIMLHLLHLIMDGEEKKIIWTEIRASREEKVCTMLPYKQKSDRLESTCKYTVWRQNKKIIFRIASG